VLYNIKSRKTDITRKILFGIIIRRTHKFSKKEFGQALPANVNISEVVNTRKELTFEKLNKSQQ